MHNQKLLSEIKQVVQAFLPQSEVFLFGSRARNENHQDSDYDVLIITQENLSPKEKLDLKVKIKKRFQSLHVPADIVLQSQQEFNVKKKLPGHISRQIEHERVKL